MPKNKQSILSMQGIEKHFFGVHALKSCQIELNKGEIHALVGENGAGKSTLMKILSGIHHRDGGTITYHGEDVTFSTPKEAQEAGISMVHQELNLMPHLTAAQNVFIGREGKRLLWNDNTINTETQKIFSRLGLDIQPTVKVENLTVGKQQLVEISKALSFQADILILDEPTAALTETEINELFDVMRDLRKQGVTMIYISHRMEEIMEITDRITVLRDGEYINTFQTSETDLDEIIHAMVGRTFLGEPKTQSNVSPDAPVVLEVRGLSSHIVKDVSFSLRKGEILGFAGLMGAGRTETARLIFGADPRTSGEIFVHGEPVEIKSPQQAVRAGIGYLSEDRRQYGLATELSVANNIVLTNLEKYSKFGIINGKSVDRTAYEYVEKLDIRTPSIRQIVRNLSGGNQQKVIVAKWLVRNSDILIFDEPTRGIDVGAKNEIYELMNELVDEGKSIIMISSELEEILRMSDRVACLCEGTLTQILNIEDADQETIMRYATSRIQA